jgi:diguanylate cyclase (GGDEF)-like protein
MLVPTTLSGSRLMARSCTYEYARESDSFLLQEELRARSRSDELTGLLNRGAIIECLTRACARAGRDSAAIAVLLVDVDNFKSINDTHGHGVGDAVLRRIARSLAAGVRGYDMIGRYGGEEFLVVLPRSGSMDAFAAAERLRTSVANEPVSTGIGKLAVTISIGLAVAETGNLSPDHLIQAADEALYRAKRAGRNRVYS